MKKQVPHICHPVALAAESSLVKLQLGRGELKEVLEYAGNKSFRCTYKVKFTKFAGAGPQKDYYKQIV